MEGSGRGKNDEKEREAREEEKNDEKAREAREEKEKNYEKAREAREVKEKNSALDECLRNHVNKSNFQAVHVSNSNIQTTTIENRRNGNRLNKGAIPRTGQHGRTWHQRNQTA